MSRGALKMVVGGPVGRRGRAAVREDQRRLAAGSPVAEFAVRLASEIREPLAVIVAYAQGGSRRAGEQGAVELGDVMDRIAAQALRAAGVVSQLQRLLRNPDAGAPTLVVPARKR